jgi:hypothetical protein
MTRAQDLFDSFTKFDSSMYVELGMGSMHVVQRFRKMVFGIELMDVL